MLMHAGWDVVWRNGVWMLSKAGGNVVSPEADSRDHMTR